MPRPVTWRALLPEDSDAVLDLVVECDVAEVGEATSTADEIEADLKNPDLEMVGVDGDRGLIGYAWVEAKPSYAKVWADARVRPAHQEQVLAPLVEWVRSRAKEIGAGRAQWIFADSTNLVKRQVLEAAGGVVVRRFYRMLIDFDVSGTPAPAIVDEAVSIRPMDATEADRRLIHRIADAAFLDHFGYERSTFEDWDRDRVGFCPDPSLYWIASVDGEPAAVLYGAVLPAAGYVDSLGTLKEFRGRGLGRALLLTAFGAFAGRGVRRVSLGVDATNPTGAVGLYESVGMAVAHEGLRYELAAAEGAGDG